MSRGFAEYHALQHNQHVIDFYWYIANLYKYQNDYYGCYEGYYMPNNGCEYS